MRTRDLIRRGALRWYECSGWEDQAEAGPILRQHTHQVVKVVRRHYADGSKRGMNKHQRCTSEGYPDMYQVRFSDGQLWSVFENELMTSKAQFTRPHPPGWKGYRGKGQFRSHPRQR
jgi:hypothetical protein